MTEMTYLGCWLPFLLLGCHSFVLDGVGIIVLQETRSDCYQFIATLTLGLRDNPLCCRPFIRSVFAAGDLSGIQRTYRHHLRVSVFSSQESIDYPPGFVF